LTSRTIGCEVEHVSPVQSNTGDVSTLANIVNVHVLALVSGRQNPAQYLKAQPGSACADTVTLVAYPYSQHRPPHDLPTGNTLTDPLPACSSMNSWTGLNRAVALLFTSSVTVQIGPDPAQAPSHRLNVPPFADGRARNVTVVPGAKW
jgi:hypothetical protein